MDKDEIISELQEENKRLKQIILEMAKELEDKRMYERAYYNVITREGN